MKKITTYPDLNAKWSDKIDDSYGLAYARAISQDWFNGGVIESGCDFSNRSKSIRENRLYVRGEQEVKKHKKLFERQDGDLSMVNLDWRIVNTVQKFCRVVSNGIRDEFYRLDIRTNDRLSLRIKRNERDKHLQNMRSMPLLKGASKMLSVKLTPEGFVPKDEEELNIYEQLKEKEKIEIAEEIIIDYVKSTNKWHTIEKEKNKNLVDNGICAARVYTDVSNGIVVEDIDPEYLIHSYTKKNDFSDCHYYGYVDTITLGDLQRESGFDDLKIRKIAPLYSQKNGHHTDYNTAELSSFLGYKIEVLRFAFKTSKTFVYKKHLRNGVTKKVTKKDENFDIPNREDSAKLSSVKDTWMEGTYVVGSEFVYDYKESENTIRDEQNKTIPPFIVQASDIYENRLSAFLDNIKPLADELQNIHNKIQHLRSELKPDLIHIDLDQLASLSSEGEKEKDWKEALSILNVKGVVLTQRVDMGEMGLKDGSPVRPVATAQGSGLAALLNLYAHYYNQIRDVTGVNPARDGSMPHDALLGVNQMNLLSSNTTTQHIVDAAINFNKRVAEVISTRVHAIFRNPQAKHLRAIYEKAVGKKNIDALEVLKDRHLHEFGFTVEMIPTQQEMQEFKEDLSNYLQQGLITPEIKSQATLIARTNVKLANKFLAYMSRRRQEEIRAQQEQTMRMKTQSDIAAAKQASQGRIQEEGIKTQMKIKLETIMSNIRIAEEQARKEINQPYDDIKFEQEVYKEKIKAMSNFDMAEFKEEAKDNRLKKQSTHQSKLIDQRKNATSPIDFENDFEEQFNLNQY
ncbi:hypothetical protein [Tenacibaculum sp. 190524A02b]|uniref:hypothetical protein n=1 Tax=Tenacibaculum vairaonense TaxID=3137860 RepID=UPI0031FA5AB2